jgi:hypothetical protein
LKGTFKNTAIESARSRYAINEGNSLAAKMALYAWPSDTPDFGLTPELVALEISPPSGVTVRVSTAGQEMATFGSGSGVDVTCSAGVFTIYRKPMYTDRGTTQYLEYRMEIYRAERGLVVRTLRAGDQLSGAAYGPLPREEAWFRFAEAGNIAN